MFSLDGSVKYWLYNKPVDMRKSFNGLGGIVTNGMCASLRSGDVYIFMNASRNMMKMLRQEEGGLVLYAVRLDMGRMKSAVQTDGYEVYESFEGAPGKMMIGCWAHVRRKFVEALDEDRKHASEAIVYSLFACCKAHDVEVRPWLEDTLRRLPTEKDISALLPENWQPVTAK